MEQTYIISVNTETGAAFENLWQRLKNSLNEGSGYKISGLFY